MNSILPSDLETELRDGAEYSPELDQLMRKARKASNFLKALSHENRLLLLCLLAAGLVIRISRARGPETVAPPLPAPSY